MPPGIQETSRKYNLAAVRAVVWVVAIMIKVAVVSEIDSVVPSGLIVQRLKGSSIRSVGGEDNLGAIGAVGRVIIIN